MITPKDTIQYGGEDKQIIRRMVTAEIIEKQKKEPKTAYLDLHGSGESYRYIRKETNARILSIDNNAKIAKKMNGLPDTRYISVAELCEEGRDKFNVIWLDYCCTLNPNIENDIILLPRIMMDKGTLFLTLKMGREKQYEKGTSRRQMEMGILATIYHLLMEGLIKSNWIFTAKYGARLTISGKPHKGKSMKIYKFTWERVEEKQETMPYIKDQILDLVSNLASNQ